MVMGLYCKVPREYLTFSSETLMSTAFLFDEFSFFRQLR
jgi:hypothetical protein